MMTALNLDGSESDAGSLGNAAVRISAAAGGKGALYRFGGATTEGEWPTGDGMSHGPACVPVHHVRARL